MIYQFPASANDGAFPTGDLLAAPGGALYGTTTSGTGAALYVGTVFRLAPPASGTGLWTETILFTFNDSIGINPQGSLIADKSGALYGVCADGGTANRGTVFKLSPPVAGQTKWTLQTLHNFAATTNDGSTPGGKLAMDASGALYGVTGGGNTGGGAPSYGEVYKLSPVAGTGEWPETILYTFVNETQGIFPAGGVTLDASGALYGTASVGGAGTTCTLDCGVAFKLTPTGNVWTYDVIHNFSGYDGDSPEANMVFDASGNLYGTTAEGGVVNATCSGGCGVVFKLAPPATGSGLWTETFYAPDVAQGTHPIADLLLDAGFAYGTAAHGGRLRDGTVFRCLSSRSRRRPDRAVAPKAK